MYPQGSNNYQINFSGLGCWLAVIGVVWLLGAAGLGWLVKSLAVLVGLLLVLPILALVGFRWWLKRNLIEGVCPVCATPLTGLNQAKTVCPNCQTSLQVTLEGFERFKPDGTVDVSAVDVTEDGTSSIDVVEVPVEVLPPAEGDRE
ncbi:MAG: hypothetical protein AAFW75_25850 [Cyanobacteria bacterium J06636_16]